MKRLCFAALIVAVLASPAQAAPLVISDITGGWDAGSVIDNDFPPYHWEIVNQAGQLVDSIRWGLEPEPCSRNGNTPPCGPPYTNTGSGYDFDPTDNPVPQNAVGTPFLLGAFTHHNVEVNNDIEGVNYNFSFLTNGVPASFNATFAFLHNETDNTPGPPASDDIVSIGGATGTQAFVVGGDVFLFELLGFSVNGGTTFTNSIISPENGSTTAGLYARVTQNGTPDTQSSPVPEPASILLVGGALGALAARRRIGRL